MGTVADCGYTRCQTNSKVESGEFLVWFNSVSGEAISRSMDRIEKTVFLSYRRTNIPWALAIFQNLTQYGYDVFFDYNGIASGDFERIILGNITARAHFLVLLTPSALERCGDPEDWLRREIETALESQRNIVPMMLESFDFAAPGIANQLTGKLAGLRNYNGLRVPPDYFEAGMERLRTKFLNVPLTAVLHRASASALQAADEQKALAIAAPAVQETELTAQQWFERGFAATDVDEKLRSYTEAIRLKPDFADAFHNRGVACFDRRDLDGAIRDSNEAIRLQPDYALAFNNRGRARSAKGDLDGALRDFNESIRLRPYDADAFYNRGLGRYVKGDLDGAMRDYDEAIRLMPDHDLSFINRGRARQKSASISGDPSMYKAAMADYQKFLDLGGGLRYGGQSEVEEVIRNMQQELWRGVPEVHRVGRDLEMQIPRLRPPRRTSLRMTAFFIRLPHQPGEIYRLRH